MKLAILTGLTSIAALAVARGSEASSSTATTSSAVQASTAGPLPQFEHLFTGVFKLGDGGFLNGPFGQRALFPLLSGNLSAVSGGDGTPVATFLLGSAEWGLSVFNDAANNTFFPNIYMSLRWTVDNKLAYLHLQGVGIPLISDVSFLHLETDSPTWEPLNKRFLLSNISVTLPEKATGCLTSTFMDSFEVLQGVYRGRG